MLAQTQFSNSDSGLRDCEEVEGCTLFIFLNTQNKRRGRTEQAHLFTRVSVWAWTLSGPYASSHWSDLASKLPSSVTRHLTWGKLLPWNISCWSSWCPWRSSSCTRTAGFIWTFIFILTHAVSLINYLFSCVWGRERNGGGFVCIMYV